MLRQAQHDNKSPFCHSEEQRDEESRCYAKLSVPGAFQLILLKTETSSNLREIGFND